MRCAPAMPTSMFIRTTALTRQIPAPAIFPAAKSADRSWPPATEAHRLARLQQSAQLGRKLLHVFLRRFFRAELGLDGQPAHFVEKPMRLGPRVESGVAAEHRARRGGL